VKVFNTNVHNAVENTDDLAAKFSQFRNLHHNAPNEVRNKGTARSANCLAVRAIDGRRDHGSI
jgi:hypothetical protein